MNTLMVVFVCWQYSNMCVLGLCSFFVSMFFFIFFASIWLMVSPFMGEFISFIRIKETEPEVKVNINIKPFAARARLPQ